jgi:hypothetical protein
MTVIPLKSRAELFEARLDAHLAMLPEESRLGFLLDQWTTWQTRYGQFIAYTAMGKAMPCEIGRKPADAFDYIQTLSAVSSRLAKLTDLATLDQKLAAVSEAMA